MTTKRRIRKVIEELPADLGDSSHGQLIQAMQRISWLLDEPDEGCSHEPFGFSTTHCAEMSCPNYIMKHEILRDERELR